MPKQDSVYLIDREVWIARLRRGCAVEVRNHHLPGRRVAGVVEFRSSTCIRLADGACFGRDGEATGQRAWQGDYLVPREGERVTSGTPELFVAPTHA